jgi:hypothetical protein
MLLSADVVAVKIQYHAIAGLFKLNLAFMRN